MSSFRDQVVVVTGASRGIGREIACRFAAGGAHVVGTDVMPLDETVAAIEEAGGSAEGLVFDVTNGDETAAAVKGLKDRFGRIDVLVNNAGITRDQLLVRMKADDWRRVLEINLDGVFNITQPVARIMMRAKSGRIVSVSSVVGLMGNAGQTNYSASKAGLIGFTKSLARELGPRGITVNAVAPGYIQTPMTDTLTDEQREALVDNLAIQRLGTPEDIADAVAFLAGPGASYITGVVLNVSGGLYI